ncbi:hypothetical protein ABH948_001338 [Bacillus sp. RC218]
MFKNLLEIYFYIVPFQYKLKGYNVKIIEDRKDYIFFVY